jgi:hypothetical protein
MHVRHPFSRLAAAATLGLTLLSTASGARQDTQATRITSITAAEFFSPTKVWTAHLTMTAEAWQAIQPRYGSFGGSSRFLGPDGGRNGVAARQGIEFDYVHATLQLGDWTFRDVAVRYKGNGSFLRASRGGGGKISLKVDLNKYVKGQKLAGLTTLNFQSNVTDPGWMNEVLAYRLYRDAGALAPRTTYADVHLTVEGQGGARFLGLFSLSENVDEAFFEERFGTRRGAILKPSTQELFTDWGPDWDTYNQSYDPKTDLTDAQKERVIALGRLVSGATDTEFAARIGDYVDLDGFARYFAVLVWLANHDSLLQNGQNFYTWLHPETNRMHFIAWDQDFSFGNNWASATSRGDPRAWPIERPWSSGNRFLARVYAVDTFRTRYFARLAELTDRLFLPERFARHVSEIAPAIRPSIAREAQNSLPAFDQIAAGRSGIVPFATARAAFVKEQLARAGTGR